MDRPRSRDTGGYKARFTAGSFHFLSSTRHHWHPDPTIATAMYRARTATVDLTQRLPVELLRYVVDYLPSDYLLLVSGVSKLFRNIVARDGRFYIPLEVYISPSAVDEGSCDGPLNHVHDVLLYAVPQRLPVGITIKCVCLSDPPEVVLDFMRYYVFPLVDAATPVLARLAVTIPDAHSPALHAALCHPAPVLRELKLSRAKGPRSGPVPVHAVPPSIFDGHAPLLDRISLRNVYLLDSMEPPAAFARARRVTLKCSYRSSTPVHVSRFFPRVEDLHLKLRVYDGRVDDPSVTFDLTGLSLHHLQLTDLEDGRLLQVVARSSGCNLQSTGPVQPGISIRSRVFRFSEEDLSDGEPFSFLTAPGLGLAERLAQIRMDYDIFTDMLECRCNLPEVHTLRVYMGMDATFMPFESFCLDDDYDEHEHDHTMIKRLISCDCPRLESIALVGRVSNLTICPRQAAYIGSALGQMKRPIKERATLELVGVHFAAPSSPDASRLLDEVFPAASIVSRPFLGYWSSELIDFTNAGDDDDV
ncbi:hypothetical protein EXIGLDRAFT_813812 [Exidia glandulosa HHB12029]|uniref:F-box domain-containing protein n=1 Tax=Exidia glandulosa HHB12029 TaxID=1314781 RepID=A0A165BWV4_EXIGL|nr:hypothetical protein EXIGLDRAFT_813812 [Exidia glandulosa HHB12029]